MSIRSFPLPRRGAHCAVAPTLLVGVLWVPLVVGAQEAEPPAPDSVITVDSASAGDSVTTSDTQSISLARAFQLLDESESLTDSVLALEASTMNEVGDALELARVRAVAFMDTIHVRQQALLDLIPELDAVGLATDSIRSGFQHTLSTEYDLYGRAIQRYNDRLATLRAQRSAATIDQLPDLDREIDAAETRVNSLLGGQVDVLTGADSLGFDTDSSWVYVDSALLDRAGNLVGRLQLAVSERERLNSRIRDDQRNDAADSELAPIRSRLQIIDHRVATTAEQLSGTADLMDQRGLSTVTYRQFVIRATGQVTGAILNPRVLWGLTTDLVREAGGWLRDRGPTWFARILIVLGVILGTRVFLRLFWWAMRVTGHARFSRLLTDLIGRSIKPTAILVGAFVGLSISGVNTSTILAGMGVAGVIVGLALQDSMSNLAAGLFILVYRPYDVDDVVKVGGVVGKVRAMGLANTTIVTFDNRRNYLPNRKIWSEVIENRSTERARRAEAIVRIGYDQSLDQALAVIGEVLDACDLVLPKPAPSAFVSKWADSWIEITVYGWATNEGWWDATIEMPRLIRNRFEELHIPVPLPQRRLEDADPDPRSPSDSPSPGS